MHASNHDEIKKAIAQGLLHATLELRKFMKWVEYDDKSILTIFAILYVWSWDAIIRICGIADEIKVSDDPETWKPIWQDTERRREKISLDDLTQFYIDGVDLKWILTFGVIQGMIQGIRGEVLKRVESLQVGKPTLFWLDFPASGEEDFLKAIEPPRKIKLKSGKSIALSNPSLELGRKRKKIDHQGLNTLAVLDFYEALKATVNPGALEPITHSPFAATYPNVSPVWKRIFHKVVSDQIDANLTELLPILSRQMEKAPLAGFNRRRQVHREERSFSALKGEVGKGDNDKQPKKSTLKAVSKIHHDALEPEKFGPEHEEYLDKRKRVKEAQKILSERLEALFNQRNTYKSTRPRLRRAVDLYIETGSLRESTKEVDEKTLRPFILELGLSPRSRRSQ